MGKNIGKEAVERPTDGEAWRLGCQMIHIK
jgi:hypothetical protein